MYKTRRTFSFHTGLLIVLIALVGFVLRLAFALRGHNYDFDSFLIVAETMRKGLNVYANTSRYNYGPIWFNLLYLFYLISFQDVNLFRFILVFFLSLIDVGIFAILYKKFGLWAGAIFFLNPISLIITGYHNQFDNVAILLGMMAVLLVGDDFQKPINGKKMAGLVVLGFSLMTKHLLFLFPVWLMLKQRGLWQKIIIMFIPYFIFITSFLPYWRVGSNGIISNVFLYNSWNNALLYQLFIPPLIQMFVTSRFLWIILLLFFGFLFRNKGGFDSLMFYTFALVGASPAITNQYLAIVVPFISVYLNPFFLAYTVIAMWHLAVDFDGLHYFVGHNFLDRDIRYSMLVVLLWLGFFWAVWRNQILDGINQIIHGINVPRNEA